MNHRLNNYHRNNNTDTQSRRDLDTKIILKISGTEDRKRPDGDTEPD